MIDRRQKRSVQPRVAARFYLDSLAMNHGLSALILATPEGKLVCGSESRRYGKSLLVSGISDGYGRQLAAVAPYAAADAERGEQGSWTGKDNEPIWSSCISIDGDSYFVAAVGYDGLAARDAALDALRGVERIFAGDQAQAA
jgi:hypothetical protein